jgi:hypothetical protein
MFSQERSGRGQSGENTQVIVHTGSVDEYDLRMDGKADRKQMLEVPCLETEA